MSQQASTQAITQAGNQAGNQAIKPDSKPASRQLSGAEIVWACLEREGVEHVFGYPGGAVLPLYDALSRTTVKHILVRHEQGAVHMADGYARASGKVGVALATSGPGATNMVTGIATAMMDSSPIVCITGQVGSRFIGTDAFQEADITGITLPITKHNFLVTDVTKLESVMQQAFEIARSGRPGPVLVDITKDTQQAKCEFPAREAAKPMKRPRTVKVSSRAELVRATELMKQSQRPVVLAGHGILLSGAMELVRQFVEKCDLPVAMTLLGIGGIPASHPLNLGMMGMHGEHWVNESIQNADLLIALGMRFDDRVTGAIDKYAPNARKIHIDIDPAELNKVVNVDAAIAGDLCEVLQEWLPMLEQSTRSDWHEEITRLKGPNAVRDLKELPNDGHLYAAHVIHDLWRETGGNAIVVTDVGQHQMWEAQYYRHEGPRTLITSGGLGTMGFALPAAIGAAMSNPAAEVWVIAGDGGFQMTMPELATLKQEGLNVKIAVINNGYLGMVRQWQEFFYAKNYMATPLLSPDFATIGAAYGILNATAKTRQSSVDAIRRARQQHGPALIDFHVEQEDSVYPMVPSGAALHEMIHRPSAIVETAAEN